MAEASARELAGVREPSSDAGRRTKLVYVMGAGHSGSTILGVGLGNCEGVYYAGELEEWLVNSGKSPIGGTERAQFWDQVRAGVQDANAIFGVDVNRCIERSSSILRVRRWPARRRMKASYRRVAAELVRAVASASGSPIVVDSSHFPLRARELKALAGIELFLIFLVRDPQSVVSSELRSVHRHNVAERRVRTLVLNANLWLTTLLAAFVFRSHPPARRLFLRHEDFLADAAGATQTILEMVGSSAPVPDYAALRTGFPLLANKLIDSETVALREAVGPPLRQSLLTALLQSGWRPVLGRMRPRFQPHAGARSGAGAC
jgi:Sulfotransferase family